MAKGTVEENADIAAMSFEDALAELEAIVRGLEEGKGNLEDSIGAYEVALAHARDPLASLLLSEDDYAWITHELCAVAGEFCDGRLVATLEGGYDLEALAASVAVHVDELMSV